MSAIKLRTVRRGVVPAAPIPSSIYDTSIGKGVGVDGFADLTIGTSGKKIFVGPGGSDGANGLTPATRKLSLTGSGAVSVLTPGAGDKVLIAENYATPDALPWFPSCNGQNAANPTCFQSYDPADPLNEAKYGRASDRNAQPIVKYTDSNGNGTTPYGFIAVQGLRFDEGNVQRRGITLLGPAQYILYDHCIVAYGGTSISREGLGPRTGHHVYRGCAIYGAWNDGGRTGGCFAAEVDDVTAEDCTFFNCGWKIGTTRTFIGTKYDIDGNATPEYLAWIAAGGPTIYSHTLYFHQSTDRIIARRNLMADGSADAGSLRGDNGEYYENAIIRNPIGTGMGSGYQYYVERPTGVTFRAHHNLTMAGIDLDNQSPRGHAFLVSNGKPGSSVDHNLSIRNATTDSGRFAYGNNADYDQDSYCDFHDNTAFGWSASGGTNSDLAFFPARVHSTRNNNRWDDPASGSNVQSNAGMFPNPYTEAELYTAIGVAGVTDYASLMAKAIAHPELHLARILQSTAFAGYGM
jgi:hypothetical protein